MNNLTELKYKKVIDKLKEKGDFGYFDYELAEFFNWQLTAVRSTVGSLLKKELVYYKETSKGWYICFVKDLKDDKSGAKKES